MTGSHQVLGEKLAQLFHPHLTSAHLSGRDTLPSQQAPKCVLICYRSRSKGTDQAFNQGVENIL